MKKVFWLLATVCILLTMPAAQYGSQVFKYKTVVRDTGGNPMVNRTVGLRISIYQGDLNGARVYCETHQAASNQFGLVVIEIGNGNVWSGDYYSIDWAGDRYYLKVDMDPDGGNEYEMLGTAQLLSVPFAIYPETSTANRMVGVLTEEEGIRESGEEGSGTQPQWNVTNEGSPVVSNPKSTTSPYWEITVGNDIYYNDGDVGIGTSNPQGNFHVTADVLTGTGTISSAGTAVTGSGTVFKTQLFLGCEITASGETKTVEKINSNSSLVVNSAWSSGISGQGFTYENPGFIVGTDGAVKMGRLFIDSLQYNKIELGTLDPYSRSQVWNYLPDSVFRLGALSADGDPVTTSSEGIVVYGKNVQGETMSHTDWSFARIKPDRIGINNSNDGSQFYIFRIDGSDNDFYLKDNSGTKTFDFDRQTGDLELAGSISLASGEDICIDGGNCLSSIFTPPTLPAGTTGEIQFNGGNGFGADSNLFWDNTNKRLGIGTATPTETLEVNGNLFMSGGNLKTDRWLQDDTNTFIGVDAAGAGNLTHTEGNEGYCNTAVGHNALFSITTGKINTAMGNGALRDNTTGSRNTAIGNGALTLNTTGSDSIAIGFRALNVNIAGEYNVAVGTRAAQTMQEGSKNTIIGHSAGGGNNYSHDGNVFLGYMAGYSEEGDDKLYIENSDSSTPLVYGEFDNDILAVNGKLGVGTQDPQYELDVNGDVRADDFIESSDQRVKQDVETLNGSLERLLLLRPVRFEFTEEYKQGRNACEGVKMGFIAQEVRDVVPEMVTTVSEEVGDRVIEDFHVLKPRALTPMLVDAVQELKAENDRLKIENRKLKSRVDKELTALKAEIGLLKTALKK